MKTAFSLVVFLLALCVMEPCVLFGVEARRVVFVHCNSDDDCQFICPPGTTSFKCVSRICECHPPENSAAKPETANDAKDLNARPKEAVP
ncbi:unnamed protein product [Coffea canephora]|uniref:Defensin-like protein n=1 Tax=Coffea canephora TaxID=49390 RepID=A0A068U9X3_COFCA|nr:unnamed protein product [Coffea canephora]